MIRADPQYVQSAMVEKEIVKTLNRRDRNDEEGLVRYCHSFAHQDTLCLVFKPLGPSLHALLLRNSQGLPPKLVQQILRQLLRSLAFLHRLGYTHTDLKPENVLLEGEELRQEGGAWLPKSGKVRLIDFGGATLFSEPHAPLICTRPYRPPEVLLDCGEWNELADVWSLGCLAAELASGELLFPADNDCEHLLMIEKNCGRFPAWMIAKTGPRNLRRLFEDGRISEAQAESQLNSWVGVQTMRTAREAVGEC